MAELINLTVNVVLRHILDKEPKLTIDEDEDDDDESSGDSEVESDTLSRGTTTGRRRKLTGNNKKDNSIRRRQLKQLLDFDGPKLIDGVRNWLVFYQIIGQLNFIGKPLYLSIIYKLLVCFLSFYNVFDRYIMGFMELNVINESFRNPIFLFISCLAVLTLILLILTTFYVNLFHLCPMYKILVTPRLCFITEDAQHQMGTRSLSFMLIFHFYTTLLMSMLVSRSWTNYVDQFYLPKFLWDWYSITVVTYYMIGLTHMDLYIRAAFGHWLLALKSHLERQFTYLHRHQRRSMRFAAHSPAASSQFRMQTIGSKGKQHLKLITLDEVQKNLNHMDDHLEVLRSIHIGALVLITLNAFLGNGALFLLTYHMLADQSNYYHGLLFFLLSVHYILAVFFSYSGDRWVFYALSSFVQTVEDEYFMQCDIKLQQQQPPAAGSVLPTGGSTRESYGSADERIEQVRSRQEFTESVELLTELELAESRQRRLQELLLIKRKDVLFCREFLHQFENHLATPWSKLTFKSHLHMIRTFVTLVAAQIIFDHEH